MYEERKKKEEKFWKGPFLGCLEIDPRLQGKITSRSHYLKGLRGEPRRGKGKIQTLLIVLTMGQL